jgi:hypothetical protein
MEILICLPKLLLDIRSLASALSRMKASTSLSIADFGLFACFAMT